MSDFKNIVCDFHKINLFSPEGFVSVEISLSFNVLNEKKKTAIEFDIPIKIDNKTVENIKLEAIEIAKTYVNNEIGNLLELCK